MSCLAITKTGKQCSRNAKIGTFCAQHATMEQKTSHITNTNQIITPSLVHNTTLKSTSIICNAIPVKNPLISHYFSSVLTPSEIKEKHEKIHESIKLNSNFTSLQTTDLQTLFNLYDTIFFKGQILDLLKTQNRTLTFKISETLTKTAGRLYTKGLNHILEISIVVLLKAFATGETSLKINGIKVRSRLEALCNLFEHELTHLIVHLIKNKNSKEGSHGKTFYNIVEGYFGHTECKHDLLGGDAEVKEQKVQDIKETLKQGDLVSFEDKDGKLIVGAIQRINLKTVTIHIGEMKYRVPYNLISRI